MAEYVGSTAMAALYVGSAAVSAEYVDSLLAYADSSGTQPAGPPGSWALAFEDTFEGSSLNSSRWSPHWFVEGGSQNGVGTYAANITVSGGYANLRLASSSSGASMTTNPSGGASPGYTFTGPAVVEARIKFPGNGSTLYNWPAWWSDGQSWPTNGENDIAEVLSGNMTVNYHSSSGSHNQGSVSGYWGDAFHVYTLHRKVNSCDVYYDGVLKKSYATDDNNAPQYLIINLGKSGTVVSGDDSIVQVDYVRGWTAGVGGSGAVSPPVALSSLDMTVPAVVIGETVLTGGGAGGATSQAYAPVVSGGTPPAYVSTATYANGVQVPADNPALVPVPATSVLTGLLDVVFFYVETTQTVTAATGFTEAADSPVAVGSLFQLRVFYRRPTGNETGTYSFPITSGVSWWQAVAIRCSGVIGSGDPFDVTNAAIRNDVSVATTPSVIDTTTGADRLWVWAGVLQGVSTAPSCTPPAGFTERFDYPLVHNGLAVASLAQTAAGSSGSVVGTFPNVQRAAAWLGALKPA